MLDRTTRGQAIDGLRQLADYLEAHPDLPVCHFDWTPLTVFPGGSEAEQRAEVDRVARVLGVQVRDETADDGHYTAARAFGPVIYQSLHIPARRAAAHAALMSYAGAITPGNDDTARAA
jgi:hypothetical protein